MWHIETLASSQRVEALQQEAAIQRSLPRSSWRHSLAQKLHAFADRLEPSPHPQALPQHRTL